MYDKKKVNVNINYYLVVVLNGKTIINISKYRKIDCLLVIDLYSCLSLTMFVNILTHFAIFENNSLLSPITCPFIYYILYLQCCD